MFTGMIESLGNVQSAAAGKLRVETILDGIGIGDSVAVNGICLTVTALTPHSKGQVLDFDVSPETIARSSLSGLKSNDAVNLERALKTGDRLGGHFVSGHIDTTGTLAAKRTVGNTVFFTFAHDAAYDRYLVPKGSVAIDGISLTVAEKDTGRFTVAVIPHTIGQTVLRTAGTGDTVNIEYDLLGKYVINALEGSRTTSKLSREFLAKNGF